MLSVNDLMNSEPRTVRPDESLARAAQALWEGNCGGLPVVDEERHPVGFLTDRDIAMAGAIQGQPLHDLTVSSSMTGRCVTVPAGAAAGKMHALMREHRVSRLPVVDKAGVLVGLVGVSDLVSHVAAQPRATKQASELRRTLGELSHSTRGGKSATAAKVTKAAGKAETFPKKARAKVARQAAARVVKKAPAKASANVKRPKTVKKAAPVRKAAVKGAAPARRALKTRKAGA